MLAGKHQLLHYFINISWVLNLSTQYFSIKGSFVTTLSKTNGRKTKPTKPLDKTKTEHENLEVYQLRMCKIRELLIYQLALKSLYLTRG